MSYFKPLGEYTGVRRVVACNPAAGQVLIDSHVTALRNGSGLPSADKACIAACVSGLNACHCCYGVHAETTKDLGVEEVIWLKQGVVDDLTDGHIDLLSAFVAPGVVLALGCDDSADANYAAIRKIWKSCAAATMRRAGPSRSSRFRSRRPLIMPQRRRCIC